MDKVEQVVYNLYPLQPRQLEFANTFVKYRLYGGAKGGGKSYAMRAECVRQVLSCPRIRGLVLRRTLPEISENMIVPMQSELPQKLYSLNGSTNIMKFANGSTLRFSYCRNYQDVLNFQGLEYDFICIEELTHWTEREFRLLMGCLRTSRKGIIPNFFGSTNPGGKGHGRVKRIFIDREFKEGEIPDQYAFIPAKVRDNFVLMETQPEYLQTLESLPEMERRAYLEGDWNVFEGQYFKEFRTDLHVIEPMIPRDCKRRIVALDYGYTAPSAVYWIGLSTQLEATVYRELYVTGKTYKQLAISIKAMTPADEKIDVYIVDPAIVNKKSETTGTSGADEMKAGGLKVKPANNARLDGWLMVRNYLQPYEDQNTKQITSLLKITSNCVNLIRTLPQLLHDKTNVEDIDTKLEDHAADALRYGLMDLGIRSRDMQNVRTANEAFTKNAQARIKEVQSFSTPPSKRRSQSPGILNKTF